MLQRSVRPLVPVFVCLLIAACGAEEQGASGAAPPQGDAPSAPVLESPIRIEDAGFAGPESALYDPDHEHYLVSNVNGAPTTEDDNGFISRVLPDGEVVALKWIDGASADLALNAPKGMALRGDTLLVADIDVVRLFHRTTGRPLGEWPVPGSAFLNDVAVGPDGTVYVTDTGILVTPGGTERTNADAVYHFDGSGRPTILIQGRSLQGPNGVTVGPDGLMVVSWNGSRLVRLPGPGEEPTLAAELPEGELDGVVRLEDGSFLVSSWKGRAVYLIDPSGAVTPLIQDLTAPADIGYDHRRGRLLIPLLTEDRVEIHPLPRRD